jgi:protein-tyrosine-phosphatase
MAESQTPIDSATRVHFICLGNAYRSIMAEAVLRAHLDSEGITNVGVLSSGTMARERYDFTRRIAAHTLAFLGGKGLTGYAKTNSEQLTQELIRPDDITICMNSRVRQGCDEIVQLPENTTTWDITDSDEGEHPAPVPGDRRWLEHTEQLYTEITQLAHQLTHEQLA